MVIVLIVVRSMHVMGRVGSSEFYLPEMSTLNVLVFLPAGLYVRTW